MTYKEFYQSFGLKEFPFDTFTTEDELEVAKQIFVAQGEYDPILDAFKKGRNIIILGERGVGKTAILEDFKRFLSKRDCNHPIFRTGFKYTNLCLISFCQSRNGNGLC